jgi:hypothetical protein
MTLPDLRSQPTPQAVVGEHLDALNRSDWQRLMAQYPADVEIFLPGGAVIRGREQVGEIFGTLVRPFADGGLGGVRFRAEHTLVTGDAVSVQWCATADFLVEPYRGADAYLTRAGLLAAQVSTFDLEALARLRRK